MQHSANFSGRDEPDRQAAHRANNPPTLDTPAADIHIIGLGPGALHDLTLGAWQALHGAARILVRTRHHPCLDELPAEIAARVQTCDDLYEAHEAFADVYTAIAERVATLGSRPGGVVYAVPGHPWVGEMTTRLIQDQAQTQGLTVAVSGGVSFVDSVAAAVGVDIMDGGQVSDAMLLAQQHHPKLDVGLPLIVGQVYAPWLASDLKLSLLNAYPPDHPVQIITAAGTPHQQINARPLHELDHGTAFDHLTSVYVPPCPRAGFTELQAIVAHLRAPEGCPWDREQTLESLRQDLLGECAEVLEAIDLDSDIEQDSDIKQKDNSAHIAEELGDLYMVATLMVQIATEEGRFQMGDVIREIVAKLIRRHPHVFGESGPAAPDHAEAGEPADQVKAIVANWEAIKAAEKSAQGQPEAGPLDGIPAHLPALEKARKMQSKAEKAGLLDRKAVARTLPKGLLQPDGLQPDGSLSAQELGALLWQVVALAHAHDLNAEDALRSYVAAFRREQTAQKP